ncbi:MAG: PaaI family thioesterase [Gammaproteobacteria bacterium]
MPNQPSPSDHHADRFFKSIPHMNDTGIRRGPPEAGGTTLVLPARKDWLGDPERGLLHPGPLTVLADSACGAAVGAALDRIQPYATLDLRMDLLRPAGPDRDVSCTAECFRLTQNIAFTRATLRQAGDDTPIATALATFMRGTSNRRSAEGSDGGTGARRPAVQDASPAWQPPADSEPIALGRQVPYIDYLGMRSARASDGSRLYRLPFAEKLVGNPVLPALHGGVIAAFAETAAILGLIEALPEPRLPKAIDFSIDYLRSGRPRETFARCEIVRVGSRVALVQVWCWQTSPAEPIALTRGHFLLGEAGQP